MTYVQLTTAIACVGK